MEIEIRREDRLSVEKFLDVLHRSGLAETRPVNWKPPARSFAPRWHSI